MPDVDIDFPSSFDPLDWFETAVRASMVQDGRLKKHPAGIYFQNIPKDRITNLAAIPYEQADQLGYMKVDFLHLSFLNKFGSKDEIRGLLKKSPDWLLLQQPSVVVKLFQIHNHYELLVKISPTSVQELADCISLIRPAKRMLVDEYTKQKKKQNLESFRKILYAKPENDRNYFKRSHAISYALTIVLQLHLIKANLL